MDRLRHGWGQSRGHPAAAGETAWPEAEQVREAAVPSPALPPHPGK